MLDHVQSKRGFDPLRYRFEDEAPAPGEAFEVATDVFWIRQPMSGKLNHINVWLLRDGDGWTEPSRLPIPYGWSVVLTPDGMVVGTQIHWEP